MRDDNLRRLDDGAGENRDCNGYSQANKTNSERSELPLKNTPSVLSQVMCAFFKFAYLSPRVQ